MTSPAHRLDPEAARVMDRAEALARRHQHDTIEPVHLLAAIFANDPDLAFEGVARETLVAILDEQLANGARAALYRDAASANAPVLSPDANLALKRAAAAYDPELAPVTVAKLLSSLWHEPTLAALIADAHVDRADLDVLLEKAHDVARACGHGLVTAHHFLAVALHEPWFAEGMNACSADVTKLRVCVESRLARPAPEDTAITKLLDFTPTIESGVDLVVHLLKERADVFAEAGVPELLLLRWFVSGHVDPGADALDSGAVELDVVFHDDASTTMEFVVELLEHAFALPRDRAEATMHAVHANGDTTVGRYPAAEARTRVAKARALAVEAMMPLRISVRS